MQHTQSGFFIEEIFISTLSIILFHGISQDQVTNILQKASKININTTNIKHINLISTCICFL